MKCLTMPFATLLLFAALIFSSASALAQADEFQPPSPEEIATGQLMDTISSWAGAWQSQLPDLFISHYALDFVPPDFESREVWVENRRVRLQAPEYIKLRLIDFELHELSDNRAVTRFKLVYERPDYSDETYKELVFENYSGLWLIIAENNLRVQVL